MITASLPHSHSSFTTNTPLFIAVGTELCLPRFPDIIIADCYNNPVINSVLSYTPIYRHDALRISPTPPPL